jgi:hypothetical protein
MTPFEEQLRLALRREPAPQGFEERLARRMRRRPWRYLAAASLLLALAAGGLIQHQRRLEGERARAQLLLALEISSEKLNATFQKLSQTQERP